MSGPDLGAIGAILDAASVIPVIALDRVDDAVPLAEALYAGGVKVAEMTARTAAGFEALAAMKKAVPDLYVGMGTLLTPDQVAKAADYGADFLVTPGTTPALYAVIAASGVPALPGVATVSEAIAAREAGHRAMKFFPAEQAGGIAYLKSLKGPLPDLIFCPTGSISADMVGDYLALDNVACVGGSWLTPKSLVDTGDWAGIKALAAKAAGLAGKGR